ncbi:acyl carrier protein [Streptomyces sp. NPDC057638]|uniref:acyl carrier protein n=1 Tax=Streptomyces sp. NPDC057638 TaxID=3346190 RepID=UPI00369604D3
MTRNEKIRAFILTELRWSDPPEALTDDFPLVERSAVDSLDTLRLASYLEQEFSITVADTEILKENFASITAMSGFVERKLAER